MLPGYDFISDPALGERRQRSRQRRAPIPAMARRTANAATVSPASRARGTARSSAASSRPIPTTASASPGSTGTRRSFRSACSANAAERSKTSPPAVLWAVGMPVAGVPTNPNPAQVINMSLGGATSCPQALQDAIDVALAQGTVITVAAGNESGNASDSAPANCSGVITVGAGTRTGDRASYSNFGVRVDISAPGRRRQRHRQPDPFALQRRQDRAGQSGLRDCRGNQRRGAARRRRRLADARAQRQPDARTRARHHQRHRAPVRQRRHLRQRSVLRLRPAGHRDSRSRARSRLQPLRRRAPCR